MRSFLTNLFSKSTPASEKPLCELASHVEDAVCFSFLVRHVETRPDGTRAIHVAARHHRRKVGFVLLFYPDWIVGGAGDPDAPLASYRGKVVIHTDGIISNEFLVAADSVLSTYLPHRLMRLDTPYTAITLRGNPNKLSWGEVKMKLIFNPDTPADYAEFYMDLDIVQGTLRIIEKNAKYRKQFVRALQQP